MYVIRLTHITHYYVGILHISISLQFGFCHINTPFLCNLSIFYVSFISFITAFYSFGLSFHFSFIVESLICISEISVSQTQTFNHYLCKTFFHCTYLNILLISILTFDKIIFTECFSVYLQIFLLILFISFWTHWLK